jgi:hypothetical protein
MGQNFIFTKVFFNNHEMSRYKFDRGNRIGIRDITAKSGMRKVKPRLLRAFQGHRL